MNIKVSNWVIFALLVGLGLLMAALIKECNNVKTGDEAHVIMANQVDSLKKLNKDVKESWAKADSAYKDSLGFERGQRMLAETQKERTEDDLNKALAENYKLIEKYMGNVYTDTTMMQAPREFVDDCRDCFTRLEITNEIALKYKKDVNEWADKFKKETSRISDRVVQVEKERDSFRFRVDSIASIQEKTVSDIKPKGRLYLSWGVLWSYWPTAAGGGLMYQTPRNMIFGAKCYYGAGKTTIETTINFPLSFKKR